VLDGLGANAMVRVGVGFVPQFVQRGVERRGWQGGAWTAVRLPRLMAARVASTKELLALVDRWVSVTPWVARLLRDNGVPEDRIVGSPHGAGRLGREPGLSPPDTGPIRLAYLGRIDPAKGIAVLFDALAQIPEAPLELDVYGIRQADGDSSIYNDMTRLAAADARVRLLPPVPHSRVADLLPQYHAVVVPSQWFETGPLVLLEAFAAGVPVVGSAIGGVADKIQHGTNGLLVHPFHAATAWAATLHECASDRSLLSRLRQGVKAPRSMREVAAEMLALYREVVAVGVGAPATDDSHAGRM
jgi:glycosyltransferase involved in cell wall biosynthesis